MLVEIRTTFATRGAAEACATRLVVEKLAACVQIDGPIRSTYRWQSAIEMAEEWRCICKTTVARAVACRTAIAGLHDYQTPEIVEVDIRASSAYEAWVQASVEDGGGGSPS